MSSPHRPPVESYLDNTRHCGPDDGVHMKAREFREMIAWMKHVEKLLEPSHRHIVYNSKGYDLAYELSPGGHIIWVTWHQSGGELVKRTTVAAVRTRLGWEFSFNAAPLELTTEAINYFAAANDLAKKCITDPKCAGCN